LIAYEKTVAQELKHVSHVHGKFLARLSRLLLLVQFIPVILISQSLDRLSHVSC